MIKINLLKSILTFFSIFSLAYTFPIQVLTSNQDFALVPYIFLFINFLIPNKEYKNLKVVKKINNYDLLVILYLSILILSSIFLYAFDIISFKRTLNTFFIYGFPSFYYLYFSRKASLKEFQYVLLSITIAGFSSGLYFAYENFSKFVLFKVPRFSLEAHEYTVNRVDSELYNGLRASLIHRGHGLLETHTVSGLWIVFGFIALIALTKSNDYFKLNLGIVFAIFLTLLGLNFTTIVSLIGTLLLIEFNLVSNLLKSKIPKKNLYLILIVIVILILINIILNDNSLITKISNSIIKHVNLLTIGDAYGVTYYDIISDNIESFIRAINKFPLIILLGDGFITYAFPKGGDIGFLDTISKLGIPTTLIILKVLIEIILKSIKLIHKKEINSKIKNLQNYYKFCAGIPFILLIYEIHYSVWIAKSVLPVFFISIAIFQRLNKTINRIHLEEATN